LDLEATAAHAIEQLVVHFPILMEASRRLVSVLKWYVPAEALNSVAVSGTELLWLLAPGQAMS
jgi:hypothetical protein